MWNHYVYIHRRATDGRPFYIGKGKHKKREKISQFARANEKKRNRIWQNVFKKHGLVIEIFAHCKDDKEAQQLEIELIAEYGRIDNKTGCLANMTDGGDGHAGLVASNALRKIRSLHAKKKRSEAFVKSIRAARKNGGNGGVVKKGDKLPESWCLAISRGVTGPRNAWYGKPSPVSKKVINKKTGEIYGSVARAAEAEGINWRHLHNFLNGRWENPTPLEFL